MFINGIFQGFLGWFSPSFEMAEESQSGGTEGESSQGPEKSGYSEFISGILGDNVPEEHKKIMEPYLKKFDAGVQRRFQDLHNKYKPYEELGWDGETLEQVSAVYNTLINEPERLYQALKNELEMGEEDGQEQNLPAEDGQESGQSFQGLPPEITARLEEQHQVLSAMAEYILKDHSSKQEAQEDKELENYMGLLKQEFGEFDEDYVLTKIANGMEGEAAVKSWQGMIQEYINKASSEMDGLPPATLSSAGGSAVPSGESQKLGQIPSSDIKKLIANVMGQTQDAGQ